MTRIDDVGRWVWRTAFRIAAGLLADRRLHAPLDEVGGQEPSADVMVPDDVVALRRRATQLADDDRRIVVLSLVGGWSAAEVAAHLGRTPGRPAGDSISARRRLRSMLEVSDG